MKQIFELLLPFLSINMYFTTAKTMGKGESSSKYLLGKDSKNPTDYYAKEATGFVHDPTGLLSEFGIKNGAQISEIDFTKLCGGYDPRTKKPLLKVHGDEHRAGVDFTFSAPKSLSSLWAIAPKSMRDKIEEINKKAVQRGLDLLNDKACFTRTGGGGHVYKQAKFAALQFQHGSNRENDPHLHLHNVVLNLSKDEDGVWRTIEPKTLFRYQTAAGAVYQNELFSQLQKEFPGIKLKKVEASFEIEGLPSELINDWSKRSRQIEEKLNEVGVDRMDNLKVNDRIFYQTRIKKSFTEGDPHEIWSDYSQKNFDFSTQNAKELLSAPAIKRVLLTDEQVIKKASTAINNLLATKSVILEEQIIKELNREFFGDLDSTQVNNLLEDLKSGNKTLEQADALKHVGNFDNQVYLSTQSMITIEQRIVELSEKMANDNSHKLYQEVIERAIANKPILSDEQKEMVRYLTTPGSIKVGEGAAGSGKSTATEAVAEAFKAQGYNVHGLAISWQAASVLGKDAKIDARAIQGFLNDVEKGNIKLSNKDVLLIDEAGLAGSREVEKLISATEKAGAKLILLGEEKQLSPVGAGPGMALVLDTVGAATIDTIRRQKTESQRQIVSDFRDGKSDLALQKLKMEDGLHFHKSAISTKNALINSWSDYTYQNKSKSTLILALKNEDVNKLNAQAREVLKKRSDIGSEDFKLQTPVSDARFSKNDKITFKAGIDELGVKNKDQATLSGIERNLKGGFDLTLNITSGSKAGEQIKINSNQLINEEGQIPIVHSYACTQWSAQGSTVDKSFVFSTGMDRRYAYVGMSRHRDSADLYVDESALKQRIALRDPNKKITEKDIELELAKQLNVKSEKLSTQDFDSGKIKKRAEDKKAEEKAIFNRAKNINNEILDIRRKGKEKLVLLEAQREKNKEILDRVGDKLRQKIQQSISEKQQQDQHQDKDNDVLRMR